MIKTQTSTRGDVIVLVIKEHRMTRPGRFPYLHMNQMRFRRRALIGNWPSSPSEKHSIHNVDTENDQGESFDAL